MNKFLSIIANKHLLIVRYLLVILCVIFITSLIPRKSFTYDYEQGKPWKYGNLYAPFTFTVKKIEDELLKEQKNILDSIPPYYRYNEKVKEEAKENFRNLLMVEYAAATTDSTINLVPEDSLFLLISAATILDTIYAKGILEVAPEHKALGKIIIDDIYLIKDNNVTVLKPITSLLRNVKEACQYINIYLNEIGYEKTVLVADLLCNSLQPNILFDKKTTREITEVVLAEISDSRGIVQEGELIIPQGKVIEQEEFRKLASLEREYETKSQLGARQETLNKYLTLLGQSLLVGIVMSIFIIYLIFFSPNTFTNLRSLTFLLLSISLFLYMVSLIVNLKQTGQAEISLYILPFCIVPIIVRNFFGSQIAILVHVLIMLISGFMLPVGFDFLFLHFTAGLMAILVNEKAHYWSQFFSSIGLIFITYLFGYLAISLNLDGNWQNIQWENLGWLIINTFFTLLAYPLVPVFEKLFGFVSDITLAELGDVNRPLLKRLSQEAPGTFWHSLQVATLAEAAASAVGAKTLLVKVGALYHDIGKMLRPGYFVENQKTAINPHDDLPYLESVQIIKEHVSHGIAMARKERLPNLITDFIRTHHGTTRIEYFYRMHLKDNPNSEVDEALFRYNGPLPYSKETAILMMADSIEAASRSLKDPNDEYISQLVDGIIDAKMEQRQFVNCNLSFKDINVIKKVFKKQLRSFYHVRISYPNAQKPAEKEAT